METEAHFTLTDGGASNAALATWLAARGGRLLVLDLGAGIAAQAMVTSRIPAIGAAALAEALAVRDALHGLGARVARVKLEVPHGRRAPERDDLPTRYLEHHVKARGGSRAMQALGSLARTHGAHLSRNAHARTADVEARFLTQRFAPGADELAGRSLALLLRAVRAAGAEILDVERERVVHDDNLGLDEGWGPARSAS